MSERASPEKTLTHLVLVGLPGSGKSTVGRLAAERLGLRFMDFDVVIERRAGRKVWEIFRDQGEEEFRRMERELTADVARDRGIVLAPGGGWMTNLGARQLLGADALLIYLRVLPETAARRLQADKNVRPLLQEEPAVQLQALYDARAASYGTADHEIDTEHLTAQRVAEKIAQLAPQPRWR